MAFIAIPIALSALSGLSGLGYYLYSSKSEDIKDPPDAPLIEVGKKYSSVMKELKQEPKHPILRKLEVKQEFAPSLDEIKNKKAELRHVEPIMKDDLSIMQKFVLSLQKKRETLNKINTPN